MIALGLGRLRLAPSAFWRCTPREMAALLPRPMRGAPARAALDALMRRFPDANDERTGHGR
ncbi:MAG TPA: rcc01693 family protein [Rhizobiaceae bacterium]|nr:rcc01693 family protein [Rhizobiaceae bacterium]